MAPGRGGTPEEGEHGGDVYYCKTFKVLDSDD